MNHSSYEEWLLSGEELDQEQSQALQNHLQSCPDCTNLQKSWSQLEPILSASTQVDPAPGFTQRWKDNLALRRAQQQRKITWRFLGFLLAGALIFFLALVIPQLGSLPTPIGSLDWIVFSFISILAGIGELQEYGWIFLSSVPLIVPISIWIILAYSLFSWSCIWFFSIWKLPALIRSKNEAHP
ncbi:MAG: zf-HC2 domain-containing protein [Chloroflexi bacterium]|nr:zf-HC2 domain-containing protein [Chloroflexota bacterium]